MDMYIAVDMNVHNAVNRLLCGMRIRDFRYIKAITSISHNRVKGNVYARTRISHTKAVWKIKYFTLSCHIFLTE